MFTLVSEYTGEVLDPGWEGGTCQTDCGKTNQIILIQMMAGRGGRGNCLGKKCIGRERCSVPREGIKSEEKVGRERKGR